MCTKGKMTAKAEDPLVKTRAGRRYQSVSSATALSVSASLSSNGGVDISRTHTSKRKLTRQQTFLSRSTVPSLSERLVAEITGTFLLMILGLGSGIAEALERGQVTNSSTQAMGWWFAVMAGVCVSEHISGGHLNPAVTLAMYTAHKLQYVAHNAFTFTEVLCYWLAQTTGALLAAATLLGLFYHQFEDEFSHESSLVFVTGPTKHTSVAQAFVCEVVATAILLVGIFAITEPINGVSQVTVLKAATIGALVFVIIVAFNGVTGPALNPARDLGPRIVCAFAGWGQSVFTYKRGFFLVPTLGPLLGAVVGTCFYHLFIRPAFHYDKYYADSAKQRHTMHTKYLQLLGTDNASDNNPLPHTELESLFHKDITV